MPLPYPARHTVIFSVLAISTLSVGCGRLLVDTYPIEAAAMEPTLQVGQSAVVNAHAYRRRTPERGDIVAFEPPPAMAEAIGARDAVVMFRIIGLPGETVEVRDGQTWVNNMPLSEPYIQEPAAYTFGPVTVPSQSYFVLGDNRNAAFDSSHWGFLLQSNLIGQVETSE